MRFPRLLLVKRSHIKDGIRSNAAECPIALALKEKFPGTKAFVAPSNIEVENGVSRSFVPTKDMINFMDNFDHRRVWKRPTLFLLWPK